MLKGLRRPLLFIFTFTFLVTCIDPFDPGLKDSESLLVVDALVTNENRSFQVKLSRTIDVQLEDPPPVTGALVSVRDNFGKSTVFQETTGGIYKSDSLVFHGVIGNSYILSIKTPEGDEYESEPCTMAPVQNLEKIYFIKDQEILNNGSQILEGIRIFIDSEGADNIRYLRWVFNEYWETCVPDPKKYNYINDSTILEVDQIKQICWRNYRSDKIIIESTNLSQTNNVEKKPIAFIASAESDRLLIRYCIEIKQLSLSRSEFDFWDQLIQLNESGGEIFDKQPFKLVSNIHNINNPREAVLGYFQVSAADLKRFYITPGDIGELNIPLYQYDCRRIVLGPDDFPPPIVPNSGMTFDKIFKLYSAPDYEFIEPIYDSQGKLQKLAFSRPVCADCSLNGTLFKPYFWDDQR